MLARKYAAKEENRINRNLRCYHGRVHTVSNPHRSGSSPTDGVTTFAYDTLDRVTGQTQPDSNTISVSYSDNCVTQTDEAGKKRKTCSDGLGRITSTFEPDTPTTLNWETDTAYDVLDNALSITQKGGAASAQWRVRTFTYDGLSRLTQATAPESGTTQYFYTTGGGALCAGSAGALCRTTDARGVTTTLAYDALSRLTGKTYSDTTPAVTYSYDQTLFNGLTITNGNGLRTSMTDSSGSTGWRYDKMGRIVTRQQTIAAVTKSIGYTYNLDGSVATMTYPQRQDLYLYLQQCRPDLHFEGHCAQYHFLQQSTVCSARDAHQRDSRCGDRLERHHIDEHFQQPSAADAISGRFSGPVDAAESQLQL